MGSTRVRVRVEVNGPHLNRKQPQPLVHEGLRTGWAVHSVRGQRVT